MERKKITSESSESFLSAVAEKKLFRYNIIRTIKKNLGGI